MTFVEDCYSTLLSFYSSSLNKYDTFFGPTSHFYNIHLNMKLRVDLVDLTKLQERERIDA